jgi:SAM-dependent methyltransferase
MGHNRAAHNLRDHAKALEKQIDAKFHPSISQQRPTRRRAGIAEGLAREARALQEVQRAMRALADAHEAGTIPEILRHIKNKPQIEDILVNGPSGRLRTAGVSDQGYQKAKKKLLELCDKPLEIPKDVEIRRMEAPLIGLKIPGFFVTPHKLAAHMVALAMIKPGMSVLEPSAGSGNIADAIREAGVGDKMDVLEYSPSLVKILEGKGHHVVGYDFLKHTLLYDRIVMNPPFERGQDVDHVRHAYECLKPGGRLVSIMGEHPFFGEDVKSVDFREWFNGLNAWDEKLLPGTFSNQVTSTDVSGRLVSIDKEGLSFVFLLSEEPRKPRKKKGATDGKETP